MGRNVSAVMTIAVTALVLTGCGIRIPADPSDTLDTVEGGVLRAGVTPNGDWVRVGDNGPTGREIDALSDFADAHDAEVEWTVGSEESLVRGLEDGTLDVVAGGLTDQTPWMSKAGMTRPYTETTLPDGTSAQLVMLVPLGENAFVSALEIFLIAEAEREGWAG